MSMYRIHVEIDVSDIETPYVLQNHGEPAGDRLRKHDGFPFKGNDWKRYSDPEAAAQAAKKLQHYLDHPQLAKKNNK